MNYKVICEFDGSSFNGWQSQKAGNTIQDNIEHALRVITGEKTGIIGCGRTDAGVSAANYVFNFKTMKKFQNLKRIKSSINALIDNNIHIKNIKQVNDTFHSRYDCKFRLYKYSVYSGISPLRRPFHTEINRKPNTVLLKKNLAEIKGKNDFSSFCKRKSLKNNNIVDLIESRVTINGNELVFTFKADRFLHNMIRLIVGTLLDIDNGKIKMSIKEIIKKKNVKYAGKTAPPDGLVFYRAYY